MWKSLFVATFGALIAPVASVALVLDWVPVGAPGNPSVPPFSFPGSPFPSVYCYSDNCGSVDHGYYISKYETTNAQYAEFLNAVAATDTNALYNVAMGGTFGGITRSGVPGSYTYTVKPGFENKPVIYVSFYDAMRFSNWLNNGQGSGDTETGAYTITVDGITNNTITRNPGAITFLPSENEWYKAAYFNGTTYFAFPAGTSSQTVCALPGATANTANCGVGAVAAVTDVGAYTGSASPYGTFDQGGNVYEWNEQIARGSSRGLRGGSSGSSAISLWAAIPYFGDPTTLESNQVGFRVASLVPEPGTGLLVMTGVLGLSASRKRRGN